MKKILISLFLVFLPLNAFCGLVIPDYYHYKNSDIFYEVYEGNNIIFLLEFPINFNKNLQKYNKDYLPKNAKIYKLKFNNLSKNDKIKFLVNFFIYISLILFLIIICFYLIYKKLLLKHKKSI